MTIVRIDAELARFMQDRNISLRALQVFAVTPLSKFYLSEAIYDPVFQQDSSVKQAYKINQAARGTLQYGVPAFFILGKVSLRRRLLWFALCERRPTISLLLGMLLLPALAGDALAYRLTREYFSQFEEGSPVINARLTQFKEGAEMLRQQQPQPRTPYTK